MLNVKYTYDKNTEATIRNFENALASYDKILRDQIGKQQHITPDLRSHLFLTDIGRKSLLDQITKIKSLAIPISIEFTGVNK